MRVRFKDWGNLIEKVAADFKAGDQLEKYTWPIERSFGIFNSTSGVSYSIGLYKFKSNMPKKALALTTWMDIFLNKSIIESDYDRFIQVNLDRKEKKEENV
jgi:hypothetical protein